MDDGRHTPEEPGSSESSDDAWEALVAAFHSTDPPGVSWPSEEDVTPEAPPEEPALPIAVGLPAVPGWRQHVPPEVPEESFIPPDPGPLPRTDAITAAAWFGVIGVPAVLVLATILGYRIHGLVGIAAVGAFVAGFAILVSRMKSDGDERPDGGAVV